MSPASRARRLRRLSRRHLWHPFTQMAEWNAEPPLIIARGRGPYLWDEAGRRYLDGTASLWVNLHGHRHPRLDRAVRAQLARIAHSTLLGQSHAPAIELAGELAARAPAGLTRVFYSDNGSTAVEVALKMAVQFWQLSSRAGKKKTRFVAFANAYHGDTIGAVSVGGIDLFHRRFAPLLFPVERIHAPYCYRCPLNLRHPECGLACLDQLETTLKRRRDRIAGIVVEPLVQAAAGMVASPPGHLRRVRELADRHGVLLIADEVATGFGRTGRLFACEHESVAPDLMAVAKGLTGGYLPLAATLATERIYRAFLGPYSAFKTFFHGHSYTGNPLGCAVALANLRTFDREQTLARLEPTIEALRRALDPIRRLPHVGDVRQRGLMAGIELVRDKTTTSPYPPARRMGHAVCRAARREGLLTRPLGDVIVLMPPLATSGRLIRRMVGIIGRSIERVTGR
ncbi:MAG: adenosylmethionine--8-amino-7-oxononanoate transaminase [Nitrospirota bacterium]